VKFPATLVAAWGLILACGLSAAPAQEAAAPDLARRLGCFACHGQGRDYPAKSLEGVGARLSRAQLRVALAQPRKLHPGAKMPSYAYLPVAERQALVDFLANLK
jgi:cbb3-type cytochrome oxidase cytochrome c subunit